MTPLVTAGNFLLLGQQRIVFLNYNELNLVARFVEEGLLSRRRHINNIDQ